MLNNNSMINSYLECAYYDEKKQSHIAFLMSGRKLISVGYNDYDRQSLNGHRVSSVHAEVDCLLKLLQTPPKD